MTYQHVFHFFEEQKIHVIAMDSFVSVLFIYEHYLGFPALWKLSYNLSDICLFDAWYRKLQLEQLSMGVIEIMLWPPHNVFGAWLKKKIIPGNFLNCNYVGKLMCN